MSRTSRRKFNIPKATRLPLTVSTEILQNIMRLRTRMLNYKLLWPAEKDQMWFLRRSFDPEILDACKIGFKYCCVMNKSGFETYTIGEFNTRVTTSISFSRNNDMLIPGNEYFHGTDIPELNEFLRQAADIVYRFAVAEYVFRWFNLHASPAVMRSYCPWLDSLTRYDFPVRCSVGAPNGLGAVLQFTREAAVTMANVLLLPECPARKAGWSVTFTDGALGDIPLPLVTIAM